MSNERSPRPVCSITMGITGDIACLLYSATNELRMLAWPPQIRNVLVARRGGAMSDESTVEREITVPVDPDRAWELVTERELITVDAFSDLLTGPSHRTDPRALAAA